MWTNLLRNLDDKKSSGSGWKLDRDVQSESKEGDSKTTTRKSVLFTDTSPVTFNSIWHIIDIQ